jgi:hypothetical protein
MSQAQQPRDDKREAFEDHERRQQFEHQLIDRKTTWLLATQGLLFAAYGFSSESNTEAAKDFRPLLALAGLLIAAIVLVGVAALIRSKWLSYVRYRDHFGAAGRDLPGPLKGRGLEWGVDTWTRSCPWRPICCSPSPSSWSGQ